MTHFYVNKALFSHVTLFYLLPYLILCPPTFYSLSVFNQFSSISICRAHTAAGICANLDLKWVILLFQLMETSGTDMLSDSESHAPISPLHLAVSFKILSLKHKIFSLKLFYLSLTLHSLKKDYYYLGLFYSIWTLTHSYKHFLLCSSNFNVTHTSFWQLYRGAGYWTTNLQISKPQPSHLT